MTLTMKYKAYAILGVLLLAMILPLGAEEQQNEWVLAAAPFTGDSDLSELLPSLILSALPDNLERTIDDAEQRDRQRAASQKNLPSLVNNLQSLITRRDSVILSSASQWEKQENISDLDAQIAEARQKVEDCRSLVELENFVPQEDLKETVVWKSQLQDAEHPQGIQALLQGSLLERGNYLYAFVTVMRYPGEQLIGSCDSVYPKTSANLLADDIAHKLLNVLVNKDPVTVSLTLDIPPDAPKAVVRLDGVPLVNYSQPITTQAGPHHFTVECDGYDTQGFTYDFSECSQYQVQVRMVPSVHLALSVDSRLEQTFLQRLTRQETVTAEGNSVYLSGGAAVSGGARVMVNGLPVLGETVSPDGVSTFFIIENPPHAPALSGFSTGLAAHVPSRTENTRELIDARRRTMYASFGLLLLSLPVTFTCYGRMADYAAQIDGRYGQSLPASSAGLWESYENWRRYSILSMGVTGVLAVNWGFQVGRYIVAANQVLPEIVYPEEIE